MARRRHPDPEDDVPRLPRGKGWSFSTAQLVRIAMVATALIAVLVLQRPCSESMSQFVMGFDMSDAGVRAAKDAGVGRGGTLLRGDMSPEQIKSAIERERTAAERRAAAERAAAQGPDAGTGRAAPSAADAGPTRPLPPR